MLLLLDYYLYYYIIYIIIILLLLTLLIFFHPFYFFYYYYCCSACDDVGTTWAVVRVTLLRQEQPRDSASRKQGKANITKAIGFFSSTFIPNASFLRFHVTCERRGTA